MLEEDECMAMGKCGVWALQTYRKASAKALRQKLGGSPRKTQPDWS